MKLDVLWTAYTNCDTGMPVEYYTLYTIPGIYRKSGFQSRMPGPGTDDPMISDSPGEVQLEVQVTN